MRIWPFARHEHFWDPAAAMSLPKPLWERIPAPESGFGKLIAADRVPGVHGAQNGQIRIGVKAIDEPLPLMVEIAANIETA